MALLVYGNGNPVSLGEGLAEALAADLGGGWAVEKYNPGEINTNTTQTVSIARCYNPDYDNSIIFRWNKTNAGSWYMYTQPYCDGRINEVDIKLELGSSSSSGLNDTYGVRGFKSAKGTVCVGLQRFTTTMQSCTRQIIIAKNVNNEDVSIAMANGEISIMRKAIAGTYKYSAEIPRDNINSGYAALNTMYDIIRGVPYQDLIEVRCSNRVNDKKFEVDGKRYLAISAGLTNNIAQRYAGIAFPAIDI